MNAGRRRPSIAPWLLLGCVIVAARAEAQAPDVAIYYGDPGPFAELLEAELSLVGVQLREGPLPAPIDSGEAIALRAETGALAIVDHHEGQITLWLPDGEGVPRARLLAAHDDPGLAPLVLAETIRAAVEADPAADPEPPWAAPPPVLAVSPPLRPVASPRAQARRARRVSLSLGPTGLLGDERGGGVRLAAFVRLHPALEVGAVGLAVRTPFGALLARAGADLGRARVHLGAGPAFWARPTPADNPVGGSTRVLPAWVASLGADVALRGPVGLEIEVGLVRGGPRHRGLDEWGAVWAAVALRIRL